MTREAPVGKRAGRSTAPLLLVLFSVVMVIVGFVVAGAIDRACGESGADCSNLPPAATVVLEAAPLALLGVAGAVALALAAARRRATWVAFGAAGAMIVAVGAAAAVSVAAIRHPPDPLDPRPDPVALQRLDSDLLGLESHLRLGRGFYRDGGGSTQPCFLPNGRFGGIAAASLEDEPPPGRFDPDAIGRSAVAYLRERGYRVTSSRDTVDGDRRVRVDAEATDGGTLHLLAGPVEVDVFGSSRCAPTHPAAG